MPASKLAVTRGVKRFVKAARWFCNVIEKRSRMSALNLIAESNRALIELHAAVLNLPHVKAGDDLECPRMSTKEWSNLYRALGRKLGKRNLYWQVFDCSKDERPVCGSLADDLADIYRDVDHGLKLLANGQDDYVREAVWQWKFNFTIHWGKHLVEAMVAMHRILSEESLKR